LPLQAVLFLLLLPYFLLLLLLCGRRCYRCWCSVVAASAQAFAAFFAVSCYILDVGGFVAAAFILLMASMLMLLLHEQHYY
jgi:hypothetical protein